MPSIGSALIDSLKSVERPGDFCWGDLRPIFMPTVDVEGVGRLAFPILATQVEQLLGAAEMAPYGRGEDTIVDASVRKTWQIGPTGIRIGGGRWQETLSAIVADAAAGLGVDGPVEADFYKLLIYDTGSFFIDHRDTEKVAGMFATLSIVLPSAHAGGDLVVRHLGREETLALRPDEPSEVGCAAFYADCVHEVRPVTQGCRLVLVYNLRFVGGKKQPAAPDYRTEQARTVKLLHRWAADADEVDKLILPLEHAYTPAELSFATLKGRDAATASVLVAAAAESDCDVHLALVKIEESGIAEHTGYGGYRRGRSRYDDGDDDEEFAVSEVSERALTLSHWKRPDGSDAEYQDFPFDEGELCPPDAFEGLEPDEQYFHEATGNEGASFERTYSRAGLVLWPRARRLAVLNQAGLGATLPYLEEMTTRWEASGSDAESPLWREADALAGLMLSTWPRADWRRDRSNEAGRMLDLLARLSNRPRIEAFLAEISGEGHYATADNAAIVRAASLLPRMRATDLLVGIIRRNAAVQLGPCGALTRCCAAAGDAVFNTPAIARALLDTMPGDPAKAPKLEGWRRPAQAESDFVVDLLIALSMIDAGLAVRAVDHMLAWPKAYDFDDVLVPAALVLVRQEGSAAWPAVERLRGACLDHLRARIALPLEPPRDWARGNPLKCNCPECRNLGEFLVDPIRAQWRLAAVQGTRDHVEGSVRNTPCDLDLKTEKRGRPYTLVATKNLATHGRRVEQRRVDLANLAALGG